MPKINLKEFLKLERMSQDLEDKVRGLEIGHQDAIYSDPMNDEGKVEIHNPMTGFRFKDTILESDKHDINIWGSILSRFHHEQQIYERNKKAIAE